MNKLFETEEPTYTLNAADISECGKYRWWLRRSWTGGDGRVVCFIMLNPSTADGTVDDPTIRRCVAFAKSWGYSILSVRNLFPYRATDPKELKTALNPTGGEHGDMEIQMAGYAHTIVCAWGVNAPKQREDQVLKILEGKPLYCLGVTKGGQPKHPLYIPANQPLIPFRLDT